MKLQTRDNTKKPIADRHALDDLLPFNGKKLSILDAERQPGLLVFPRDLGINGDDIGNQEIFHIENDILVTGNVVGFIGIGDTDLTISSRFCTGDEDDYFLHYMLQKVMGVNVMNLQSHTNDERIYDFLLYLFPRMLINALTQGLYKEYKTMKHNDSNVKGVIDISRHVKHNIPFFGNIAYNTREHSYDNDMTELIRHTIELIRHSYAELILHANKQIEDAVLQIVSATPSYSPSRLRNVIINNTKPIRHPYYSLYMSLQRLCLMILRHEKMRYGNNRNQIHGILFDAAWLWEEYLNTLFSDCGFKHPQNKLQKGGIQLFSDNNYVPRYPDFLKSDFILDAKYKHIDGNPERDDFHQIITYMYVLEAMKGGFVYPSDATRSTHLGYLNGYGGELRKYAMKVPLLCQSLEEFKAFMRQEEKAIMHIIGHN